MPATPTQAISLVRKSVIAAIATGTNALVYMVPNHSPRGVPRFLPWTPLDDVPFIPQTIWLYLSAHVLVASAFFMCPDAESVRRFTRAFFSMLVVGSFIHWWWPTTFPREHYELLEPGLSSTALTLLRQVDAPTSCLPSMHVAFVALAALSMWDHSPWQRWISLTWATAVSVSTLTTKQHYAVDIVAGATLALVFWALFFRAPEWLRGSHSALRPSDGRPGQSPSTPRDLPR